MEQYKTRKRISIKIPFIPMQQHEIQMYLFKL